jgi:two-component system chemotaxis sensor kinase CheA
VDHGIEYAHDRIIDGKSEQGTVIIEAVQESNSVTISIRDDGKGLDPVRIFNKAVEKGLIDAKEKLSENEILSLIFLPGFSTAEKLTDVSGRGVGMDVVMRSVEGLGGKVKIGSQVGKGTNFMISLPTSLSIVDALIFTLKGVRFAVPMNAIEEVLDISDGRLSDDVVMMKHQNRVIPVSSMASFLKMKPVAGASDVEGGAFIVRHEGKLAAFKFGDLLGEQQIVVRQLSPSLENTFGFSGATILGDGDPGLIVDMPAICAKFLKAFNMKESA